VKQWASDKHYVLSGKAELPTPAIIAHIHEIIGINDAFGMSCRARRVGNHAGLVPHIHFTQNRPIEIFRHDHVIEVDCLYPQLIADPFRRLV